MLAKGQLPVIRRLSELIVSRCRTSFLDADAPSPTSHFDLSPSPRGNLKSFNAGVGLGIVAALDTSTSAVRGCEILVKHAVCSPILNSRRRPVLIPIAFAGGSSFSTEEEDDELNNAEENYTYVTTCGPHESSTRVFYDGGLVSVGCRKSQPLPRPADQPPPRRTLDFLRSCHLCGKNLEGKDIYMYRGESAFCSSECRSSQIMKDETKERCRSEARSTAKTASSSPYNRGIFSTGILAI